MKKIFALSIVAVAFALASCTDEVRYREHVVDAPFAMEPIKEYIFPERQYVITDYIEPGDTLVTEAIRRAIEECNAHGGGHVIVPRGTWRTGAIHFMSNVDLHLEEGAVLRFTDRPDDYLPAVMTSWEGLECYNYSPLVYAFECENIAITGSGTLSPEMHTWRTWFSRPPEHLEALKTLYTMGSTDVPVVRRQMATGSEHLRPHLIHFNRCKNVLLDGFSIRESPFWTIHIYMCDGGIARKLDVRAHGHNNDGIDLEMTRNFLVEDCTFDQGDDAVVIKSGRNRDAWRLNAPCENIVIRRCTILAGHTLLGIGSELSGGVRNIFMHDCTAPKTVHRLFFVKTNHRRGGFVENIYMNNIETGGALSVAEIDTDVLYQWRTLVPTYEKRITRIDGIHLSNIYCHEAKQIYDLKGDERLHTSNVSLSNIRVDRVASTENRVVNVDGFETSGSSYNSVDVTVLPELDRYVSNK